MSQPNEVIASLSWDCKTCERNGVLHLGVVPDVLGVWGRIKRMHEEASPSCVGAPNYVQIDVPEGAEVNDPRARDHVPALRGAAALAVAGMLASDSGLIRPARRGWNASMREQADAADRLARRDRLVAKAEAKRARKASRSAPLGSPRSDIEDTNGKL